MGKSRKMSSKLEYRIIVNYKKILELKIGEKNLTLVCLKIFVTKSYKNCHPKESS
jgi:hypothetical protein